MPPHEASSGALEGHGVVASGGVRPPAAADSDWDELTPVRPTVAAPPPVAAAASEDAPWSRDGSARAALALSRSSGGSIGAGPIAASYIPRALPPPMRSSPPALPRGDAEKPLAEPSAAEETPRVDAAVATPTLRLVPTPPTTRSEPKKAPRGFGVPGIIAVALLVGFGVGTISKTQFGMKVLYPPPAQVQLQRVPESSPEAQPFAPPRRPNADTSATSSPPAATARIAPAIPESRRVNHDGLAARPSASAAPAVSTVTSPEGAEVGAATSAPSLAESAGNGAPPAAESAAPSEPEAPVVQRTPFDEAAAHDALDRLAPSIAACDEEGESHGHGVATVIFSPSGHATRVTVRGAPFAGTELGSCIARTFRNVTVAPFVESFAVVDHAFKL